LNLRKKYNIYYSAISYRRSKEKMSLYRVYFSLFLFVKTLEPLNKYLVYNKGLYIKAFYQI